MQQVSDRHQGKLPYLLGVFLLSCALLVLQIVQTRILSVIAWYYLAFFAISVAMLGMTTGAVWVYVQGRKHGDAAQANWTWRYSQYFALSLPLSLAVMFSLVTTLTATASTVISWFLLLTAMAMPYFFAGVVLSLALTRSPYPVSQVYGVDLIGAAFGCIAVIVLLNLVDAPTVVLLLSLLALLAAACFKRAQIQQAVSGVATAPKTSAALIAYVAAVLGLIAINLFTSFGFKPLLVKDRLESRTVTGFERWNSYSRIRATEPRIMPPLLWGPSPTMPLNLRTPQALLNIDGEAGTVMHRYDGTRESIDFLRYDIVNLAYRLPNLKKSAVIGVGGGRDILSAHLFGVEDITGVELNPIFIHLHTKDSYYSNYSGLKKLPKLNLQIDDARSWFAGTKERFDLIQMSMIDTWAATGAGAFSLSENGLYTLEGWRAFMKALQPGGFFTVARWYNPSDVNETGRMIGLATAVLLDSGVAAPREHMVVFNSGRIATLIVAKQPFTDEQLGVVKAEASKLGFSVLLSPEVLPKSPVLAAMVTSTSPAALDAAASSSSLDLTPPTDSRPFFFNQLRFSQIGEVTREILNNREFAGVLKGNLQASAALLLIFVIALIAVVLVIVLPLSAAAKTAPKGLLAAGTSYFALIGMGFMLAEIALLQHFSIYLGHPIYSLGVCLFSLILATGLGSLASGRWPLATNGRFTAWALLVAALLLVLQQGLLDVLHATTAAPLVERIAVALAVLMPVGLLLGFAFPTGMVLVQRRSQEPTPWFWGINGATGVMASVLAIMLSMTFGIDQTILIAALCYLLLLPAGLALIRQSER